jgi:hypothetical protein
MDVHGLITQSAALSRTIAESGGIPFAQVVEAATGLPVHPVDDSDTEVVTRLDAVFRFILEGYETTEAGFEISVRMIEDQISDAINCRAVTTPLVCDKPRNVSGKYQASGYPDLALTCTTTGRVYYLSMSTCTRRALDSSLRTLYYSPSALTGKATSPARHCMVVFLRETADPGTEILTGFRFVDLAKIKLNFKAEFNAGNRVLVQSESILRTCD